MRRVLTFLAAGAICVPALHAQNEAENVAAFARLYGVARWFYPSDAAAGLDWNRFAVHAVSRVRGAQTPADLERALEELFTPLGPGIEVGTRLQAKPAATRRDPSLVAWQYHGAAMLGTTPGPYRAKRMNRVSPVATTMTTPGILTQMVRADTLSGRTIRMTGRVRLRGMPTGLVSLWLRVDRSPGAMGFFDNMMDRPIADTAWREYVIEGPIADDATAIYFGAIAGGTIVDIDDVKLSVRSKLGPWTALAIADGSFEDSTRSRWSMASAGYTYSRERTDPVDGAQFLRIAPSTPVTRVAEAPSDSLETPMAGATVDVELGRGLRARVPLSLTDAEARTVTPRLAALRDAVAAVGNTRRDDVDVRLADVVMTWNVFRHFYPYWGDINVDWDARLRPNVQAALDAGSTRQEHHDVVRSLVAELRDGHGSVIDPQSGARSRLPLQLRLVENQVVVTASSDANVPVGSVVTAIDGTPAMRKFIAESELASGTPQWRAYRAAMALSLCRVDSAVTLRVGMPSGAARDAILPCAPGTSAVLAQRPDSVTELQPGIWYVDLTRIRAAQLRANLDTLAKARAVIFDVRGYPTDAGAALLPHLMSAQEDATDTWMHVPRITGPFGQMGDWQSFSWNLRPATPHIGGQRVFLTDGTAISYAESVMGYIRDHKLATIVGGTTAGANGNIARFTSPGGFGIVFTGMRVTRHDGRTPFHTAGVGADVPVEPTIAGIRAGRDEVLERALALLRLQP